MQVLKDEMTDLMDQHTKESKTRYILTCHTRTHIIESSIVLGLSRWCRQAVEDNYNDLQAQIEAQRSQHAETMALLSTKMEEAKKQNNDMSDRVG